MRAGLYSTYITLGGALQKEGTTWQAFSISGSCKKSKNHGSWKRNFMAT